MFVVMAAGALVVPLIFVLQFGFGWPVWAVLIAGLLAVAAATFALLRPTKALLFALQWRHKAQEGRLSKE